MPGPPEPDEGAPAPDCSTEVCRGLPGAPWLGGGAAGAV